MSLPPRLLTHSPHYPVTPGAVCILNRTHVILAAFTAVVDGKIYAIGGWNGVYPTPLHAACETCAEFQKILRWTQQQNEFDPSVSLYENIRLFATKHKIHRIRRGWSYAKNV